MKFTEHNVTAMLAELYAVHQYAHEFILVRELAASHKLEQMCRVPMLKNKKPGREKMVSIEMR